MINTINKTTVIQVVLLLLLTTGIFLPLHLTQIAFHDITDYRTYIVLIRNVINDPSGWSEIANLPGWPLMVMAATRLFQFPIWKAALFIQMGIQSLLALILFFSFKRNVLVGAKWLPIALPLAIMLAAPVFLIALEDNLYYFGYVGINSNHNPTIIALKPFVMLVFFFACAALRGQKQPLLHSLICAGSVVTSTLIKPSYIICLLPAVGIISLIRLFSNKDTDLRFILFSVSLPAILVLFYEYLSTYGADDIGIIFSPLTVMRNSSGWLLAKFILSAWFPLLASAVYIKELRSSICMLLAWLTFIFGAGYTYLVAEGGWRIFHGNFTWSGEITLFVLFTATTFFFFKQRDPASSQKEWAVLLLAGFIPHIICGLIYFSYCLMNNRYF